MSPMPAPSPNPLIPDPPIHPVGPNDPKPKARNATAAAPDQLVNVGNLDEEEPSLGRPVALARFERDGSRRRGYRPGGQQRHTS